MQQNTYLTLIIDKLITLTAVGIIVCQLQGCAALVIAGGAGAVTAATDRRSAGTMLDDEGIELKVTRAINTEDKLKQMTHINAASFDYVVLLTGEAPTEDLRELAAERARYVDQVKTVYNEIIVSSPSTMDSRSKDTWITTKLKANLVVNKKAGTDHVKVITEDQTVYLMGLVSREEGQEAANVARYIDGVKQVVTLFEYID